MRDRLEEILINAINMAKWGIIILVTLMVITNVLDCVRTGRATKQIEQWQETENINDKPRIEQTTRP